MGEIMNLCIDCKHSKLNPKTWRSREYYSCHRGDREYQSPIDGSWHIFQDYERDCKTERVLEGREGDFMEGKFCSPKAIYWEAIYWEAKS